MGIMITFGSYMPKKADLEKSVTQVEIFDTGIAMLAGLMIIPVFIASLFMIVPGIVLSIAWSLAYFFLFEKKKNPMQAISASNEATYGSKWTMFFVLLAFVVAAYVIAGIFAWICAAIDVGFITFVVLLALVAVIMSISLAINASFWRQLKDNVQ